jgi:hypothetical protein
LDHSAGGRPPLRAEREYAYDRKSDFGRLDAALDAAAANGWTLVDMKRDWKRVFEFQSGDAF